MTAELRLNVFMQTNDRNMEPQCEQDAEDEKMNESQQNLLLDIA